MSLDLVAGVIEDPDLSQEVVWVPHTGTTNIGGSAVPTFGPSQSIRALVRPQSALDFEIGEMGQHDAARLYMFVSKDYGIENDDRIVFRGTKWRATQEQIDYSGTPEFALFTLVEDSRASDNDSSTDEPPDSGDGTDSGSGGSGSDDSDDYVVIG